MKFYRYEAEDSKGRRCSGTMKARAEDEVRAHLESKGIRPIQVEEDYEATSKLSKRTLQEHINPRSPRSRINEILSYAMPLGAAAIALLGIPLVMQLIRPDVPAVQPEKIVEEYWGYEQSGTYEKQYELLSQAIKKSFDSAGHYARQRRLERLTRPEAVRKLSGIKKAGHTGNRARFEVRLLSPDGITTAELFVRSFRGKWHIEALRDPERVSRYLADLSSAPEGEKRRILVALKTETGYSDLEIDGLLKKYEREKRREQLGGDYIFNV